MRAEGKSEGPPKVVAGRIEELRRLQASERALAGAYRAAAAVLLGGPRLIAIAEGHRTSADELGERIAALGGEPHLGSDDEWILGRVDQWTTLTYAERTALATWHDHLLDLDGETVRLVRERILPRHERALAELIEEIAPLQHAMEATDR